MGETRRAGRDRSVYGRRGRLHHRRGVRATGCQHRTLIYRHELPRKKVRAMDRVKLDCMPDPFGWMGGKNNLHKTVCHETDI